MNPTLAIESEFLNSLNSENTRLSYTSDITQFMEFLGIKSILNTSRDDILRWKEHLMFTGGRDGDPSAPYTVARKLSSLKAYFSFLAEHRNIPNPFVDIKSPSRIVKNERQILDIDEIEEMIIKTNGSKSAPLHAALIALNFYAVIRLNEFLEARIEDFYKEKNLYFLKAKTKGNKYQIKEIPYPVAQRILEYLDWMKSLGRDMHPKNYLFRPSRNNHQGEINIDKKLNPRTINRLLKKYSLAAGILKNISSHSGRASAITNYLNLSEEENNVADIYGAKMLAGHSKISTTEVYDKKRRDISSKGKITHLYKRSA
jgi:site-specific recombinase XerD